MPRFLTEQGLRKVIDFLEMQCPGINKILTIDSDRITLGEQIGFYAVVLAPISEDAPIQLSAQKPLQPGNMANDLLNRPEVQNKAPQLKKTIQPQIAQHNPQLDKFGKQVEDLTQQLVVARNAAPAQGRQSGQQDTVQLDRILGDIGKNLKI